METSTTTDSPLGATSNGKLSNQEAAAMAAAHQARRSGSHTRSFQSVDEYVRECQGKRVIRSILIANNGISAVKAIRSIRRWSYEMFADEHMITFVVMATPEDLRANAEYIRMAEQVVEVPGGTNNHNYANVALIVEMAERFQVDAVWAGWGHASENPALPDALAQTSRKIVFIGPPSKPMRALGDKIGSTILAQSAKVPTISWNGDGIVVNYQETGDIPSEIYNSAQLRDGAHCLQECKRIGFPVMIKASEGGGGKGIRKVTQESQVQSAWEAVRGEIPGSPVFVMKLASKSRHLEVQLLADEYGNAIALSGRDCSVQRRHQKIVEEGPVLAPSPDVWEDMMKAATRLAKEVQYVNAGTVEYLFSEAPEDAQNPFFFLELNPRLQVEHPVTEMITNVNLPAAQLQVAMGIPLHFIPDIRRLYQKDTFGKSPIDFDHEKQIPPHGHVIAARITAEDPNAGFQPTSGAIQELNFRSTPDVWGYFSVDSSGRVHEYADSQIGHLFSWSTSRDRARKNMIIALKELSIRGDIHTTVEYIVNMMESDDFKHNRIHTGWLDERIARHQEVRLLGRPDPLVVVLVGAVCSAYWAISSRTEKYVKQLERGQLPPSDLLSQSEDLELIYEGVKYKISAFRSGEIHFTLYCNNSYVQLEVRVLSDGGFLVLLNGKSHVAYASREVQGLRLVLDGHTCLFTKEYDPTRLVTKTAGKLARYLVKDGATLARGTPYAEMEVMKMYMPLLTPEEGVIKFTKAEGVVLAPGDCIATMELKDPSCVKKSELFKGKLSVSTENGTATNGTNGMKNLHKLRQNQMILQTALDGYFVPEDLIENAVISMFQTLECPLLAVEDIKETLSALAGRIPLDVLVSVNECFQRYQKSIEACGSDAEPEEFNAEEVVRALDEYAASLQTDKEKKEFESSVANLRELAVKYKQGLQSVREQVVMELMTKFHDVEKIFAGSHNLEDVILDLRQKFSRDLYHVYAVARSHAAVECKSKVLLDVLLYISQGNNIKNQSDSPPYLPLLERLATFQEKEYSLLALQARQLLMGQKTPSYLDRLREVEGLLKEFIAQGKEKGHLSAKYMATLDQSQPIFDLLVALLDSDDAQIRESALELYIRRVYRSYVIDSIESKHSSRLFAKMFVFKSPVYDALSVGLPSSDSENSEGNATLDKTLGVKAMERKVLESNHASSFPLDYEKLSPNVDRYGVIAKFSTLDAVKASFGEVLDLFPLKDSSKSGLEPPTNVLHMVLVNEHSAQEEFIRNCEQFLGEQAHYIRLRGLRRISFAVKTSAPTATSAFHSTDLLLYPSIYTFPNYLNFTEDRVVRHIEAPLAYKLELRRLRNYHVEPLPSENKNVHLYLAQMKEEDRAKDPTNNFKRIFVRAVVRQLDETASYVRKSGFDAHPTPERTFVDVLNCLELAVANEQKKGNVIKNNHIFMNILPEAVAHPQYVEGVIWILATRYGDRLQQLRVSHVELKIPTRLSVDSACIPVRLVMSNPTGFVLRVETYVETVGPDQTIFTSISDENEGELDGMPITTPYPVSFPLGKKREQAKALSNTVYIYDFLELFEHGLQKCWRRYAKQRSASHVNVSIPNVLLDSQELVLNKAGDELITIDRAPGKNDIGMVAWLLKLYTPEYPEGRELIVIGNDITFKAGSFGTREDRLFELASRFARKKGIPRLFLSANAGARLGMAESVKSKYRICWKDDSDPSKGFEYLYLTPDDFKLLSAQGAVNANLRVTNSGESRYVLSDVLGIEEDLGVECLRGSGTIAGETSRAYDEVFTLSYACGRSVGIGAYLIRLGQRTIQTVCDSPIILTGYQALNKLMGKPVYTSNDQLGGVKIMHTNGVTHQTVKNHLFGVLAILDWLSFVPKVRRGPLPIRDLSGLDVIERPIEFAPLEKSQFDPRYLLTGKMETLPERKWLSGFFDRSSFIETLDGWAKSVIVGRARLGGIPCGVVLTELRKSEKTIPADPASPSSQETLLQQAGQVWFPDSAHKTATAIKDFRGEDLPLFVFANWRGFSGGQRDMFDEVLKFGAAIVDALVAYEQPVFVYIPPFSELRGGAWAVVDPTINKGIMEMYADPTGRGGVLEPAGLVEIKYRKKQLLETMHRLDETLLSLDARIKALALNPEEESSQTTLTELKRVVKLREDTLLPVYVQIATEFGDLHDSPGRMKAKQAIREVVPWQQARTFFYWRLKRRLEEFRVRRLIVDAAAGGDFSFVDSEKVLFGWFTQSVSSGRLSHSHHLTPEECWNNDKEVVAWLFNEREWLDLRLKGFAHDKTSEKVVALGMKNPKAAVAGVLELLNRLSDKDREEAIAALRRGSIFHRSASGTKLYSTYLE